MKSKKITFKKTKRKTVQQNIEARIAANQRKARQPEFAGMMTVWQNGEFKEVPTYLHYLPEEQAQC